MSENGLTVDALRPIRVTDPPSQMSLLRRDTPAIRTVADRRIGTLGSPWRTGRESADVPLVDLIYRKRLGSNDAVGEEVFAETRGPAGDRTSGERHEQTASSTTVQADRGHETPARPDWLTPGESAPRGKQPTARSPPPSGGQSGTRESPAGGESDTGQRTAATPKASGPPRPSTTPRRPSDRATLIAGHRSIPVALTGSDGGYRRSSSAGSRPALQYRRPSGRPDAPGTDTGGRNSFTRQSLLSADTDPFRLDSHFEFSRTYSHQYEGTVAQADASPGSREVNGAHQAASTPDHSADRKPGPADWGGREGVPGREPQSKLSAGRLDPGTIAVSTPIRPGGEPPVARGTTRDQQLSYRNRVATIEGVRKSTGTTTGLASVRETIPAEPTDQKKPGSHGDTTVRRSSEGTPSGSWGATTPERDPEQTTRERPGDVPAGTSGKPGADKVRQPTVTTGTDRVTIPDRPDRRTVPPPIEFTYLSRSRPPETRVGATGAARRGRATAHEPTIASKERVGPEDGRASTGQSVRPDEVSTGDGPGVDKSADRHARPPFPVAAPVVPAVPVQENLRRLRGGRSTGKREDPSTSDPIGGEPATTRGDAVDPRTGMPAARSPPRERTPADSQEAPGRLIRPGNEVVTPRLDYLSPAEEKVPDDGTPGPRIEPDASRLEPEAVDGPSMSGGRGSERSRPEDQAPSRATVARSTIGPQEPGDVASSAERAGQSGDAAFERQPSAPRLQTVQRRMPAGWGEPERHRVLRGSVSRQSTSDSSAQDSVSGAADTVSVPAGGGIETVLTQSDPARTPVARRGPVAATEQSGRHGQRGVPQTVAHAQLPVSESARTGTGENLMNTASVEETVRFGETTEMPSLTLQTPTTAQSQSGSQEQRRPSPSGPGVGQERDVTEEGATDTSRADRRHRGPAASGRDGRTRVGRRPSPPVGRETASLYPDLTVKTLAPRIDATQREESTRDVTRRSREQERGAGGREQDLEELLSGSGIDASPSSTQVDRLVEKLYRKLERKMRIERERRGL